MHIGSSNDFIVITELERVPKGVPNEGDVRVCVQVKLGDFDGKYESVWLDGLTLREFVQQLARLEESRAGSVTLTSCSPGEFIMKIRSADKLGHFVAEVSLCRNRYIGSTLWPTTVSGGFEIDPSSLPSLLDDFRGLHTPNS
jgi:hypothetical protein